MRKLLKKTLAITGCVAMMASMTACGAKPETQPEATRTGSKGGGRDGSELREHEGCQHKN